MYRIDMKLIKFLLICLTLGCAPKVIAPDEKPAPHTHPVPVRKPKRMVCSLQTTVIAVIDTGFSFSEKTKGVKLCKFGHKDFTKLGVLQNTDATVAGVPVDNHGHGTNVAGLIQKNAGEANFCMVILKYYDPRSPDENNAQNTVKAIEYATNIGVKYINYSGGGTELNRQEQIAVKRFLDRGGRFIAAAGNEKQALNVQPYYPAMDDDRVTVVGSIDTSGEVAYYSNWGKRVNRWEYGSNQVGFGINESGTSQATAVATGKIVKESECHK